MFRLSSHQEFVPQYIKFEFFALKYPKVPTFVSLINIPSVHLSLIQETDTKIHFYYTHNCEQSQHKGVVSRRHLLLFAVFCNNFMAFSPRRYSRKTSRYFRASFALLNRNEFLLTGNLLGIAFPQALVVCGFEGYTSHSL